MANTKNTKGISLAKGPVGLVGLLLLAYGVAALIFGDHNFTQHLPNGTVHGKKWIGLEVNGWSCLLFAAGGLLLLLGSPVHWGAKTMSLFVGIALGAAGLVGLATRERGVFGLLAANHLTELVWGAAGVLLVLLSSMPRVGGRAEPSADGARVRRVQQSPRPVEQSPRAVEQSPRAVEQSPRAVEPESDDAALEPESDDAALVQPTRVSEPGVRPVGRLVTPIESDEDPELR